MDETQLKRAIRKAFLIIQRRKGFRGRRYHRQQFLKKFLYALEQAERNEAPMTVTDLAKERVLRTLSRRRVHFAQVPVKMLKSVFSKGKPQEVVLYLLLHSYAPIKGLKDIPKVQVAEDTLASDMGIAVPNVSRWLGSMEKKGWIRIIRQGKMMPNIYELYWIGNNEIEGRLAMERVQIRIQRDYTLAKRLRESLHPRMN